MAVPIVSGTVAVLTTIPKVTNLVKAIDTPIFTNKQNTTTGTNAIEFVTSAIISIMTGAVIIIKVLHIF